MMATVQRSPSVVLSAIVGFVAAIGVATSADAGRITITPNGGYFNVPATSLKEARFKKVIKQQYDFSCGSAALATLLTYEYDRPTSEKEIFKAMWEVGDQEQIQRLGFSLLDMKKYLEGLGLRSDGFKVSLDKLMSVGIPAIVLINTNGYKHFVVIKGLRDGNVLVGDPALGMNVKTLDEFKELWNSIVFVIRDDMKTAKANFNEDEEWQVKASAPFGTALTRQGLANFTLLLPGSNDF